MRLIKRFSSPLVKTGFLIAGFILLTSHNLYIKMGTYFLSPNKEVTLSLFNGTFEESENVISRDRMLDASLVYNGNRYQIDNSQWTDKDTTVTQFTFTPVEEGTYVTGVSTKARNIELTAEKFNNYLLHDGVVDMLEYRKTNNLMDQDAIESYQKHVKAIHQVGNKKSEDWNIVLGYPIEFIPQENPYDKYTGENLEVQLLLNGKPLANQVVYVDYVLVKHNHHHGHNHDHGKAQAHDNHDHSHDEKNNAHEQSEEQHSHAHDDEHTHEHSHDGEEHSHDHKHDDGEHNHSHNKNADDTHEHHHDHKGKEHSHNHKHDEAHQHIHDTTSSEKQSHSHEHGTQLRTNNQGIVTVEFPEDGVYYLRTIHMKNVTNSNKLTHESKWATLSFEVTHSHEDESHSHDDHEHEDGIPMWMFIVGSLLIILILFFIFRKKN